MTADSEANVQAAHRWCNWLKGAGDGSFLQSRRPGGMPASKSLDALGVTPTGSSAATPSDLGWGGSNLWRALR